MRSLANLLEEAVRRSATEVVLESGQPVVFTTARGSESEPRALPRTELFDMIVAAVDDSQQVELAVGNPVEFELDAGGVWSIHAEPGMEGMMVRARRSGGGRLPNLEIELDGPDGFGPGDFRSAGFGGPSLPDDADFEVEFDAPAPASAGRRPRSPSQAPPSQLHVEALDVPSLAEPDGDFNVARTAPAAPFESGTWALADEEDFDVGLDDPEEGSLPTGFPEPPRSAAFDAGNIGVPDDDDDESSFDPFADVGPDEDDYEPRRGLSPTLPAVGAVAPAPASAKSAAPPSSQPPSSLPPIRAAPIKPPPPIRAPSEPIAATTAETPTRRDLGAAASSSSTTRRELGSLGSPEADTRRELPTVGRGGPLGDLAADIPEGALVYVREPGLAESLGQAFAAPTVTIDDQISPDEVWGRIRGLPSGAIVIVRRDDPSALLGWILRRLEEGYRVFVETRARTPEGARRILLGVGASDRAERWLDGQVALAIEPGESGPRVRRTN